MTMEGIDTEEFIQTMKQEYANLRLVMEREPLIDKALILLSMAAAVKCMDWTEPEKMLNACKESVKSVTEYASGMIDQWAPEGRFVFYGNVEIDQNEWNSMFMESQNIAEDLLQAHMEKFGTDSEEAIMRAYNETMFCLTYMISAGCARSIKPSDAVEFVQKNLDFIFDFIRNNCNRIEQ